MAPSPAPARVLLIVALILVLELSANNRFKVAAKTRYSSTRQRRGYMRYTSSTTSGSHGKGLSWWKICLIIGGIGVGFLLLWYFARICKNREPRSDTPGIESTRDCIQLRDHQMVNHFPRTNYQDDKTCEGPYDDTHRAPDNQMPPPPSYDDALQINKEPVGVGAGDDGTNIKQFGMI